MTQRIDCASAAACQELSAAQVEFVVDMVNVVVPTIVGVLVLLMAYDEYRIRTGAVD